MSIYDEHVPKEPFNIYEADEPPVIYEADEPAAAPPAATDSTSSARRAGCGCGSCLGGCLVISLVCLVLAVAGGWFVWTSLPEWTHNTLVAAVEQSDLSDEEKREVVAQIDRVFDEYEAGRVTVSELMEVAEQLAESPVLPLAMSQATIENYIKPSGLSDAEKEDARLTLGRVARGVYEKRIDPELLEPALDYLSTKEPDGSRQFNKDVTEQELRAMLAECKRLADEAGVPEGPFQVNIGAEIRRAVDNVLADSM